jgi:hypothetical protein
MPGRPSFRPFGRNGGPVSKTGACLLRCVGPKRARLPHGASCRAPNFGIQPTRFVIVEEPQVTFTKLYGAVELPNTDCVCDRR